MDKYISTALGGIPKTLNDNRWALGQESNQGIIQALNNMLGANGTNFVVQGCVLSGVSPAVVMTEGWIILSGELLKVSAATGINTTTNPTFTKDTTFNSAGLKDLQSGGTADTYQVNRGILNGVAGTLNVLTGDRLENQFGDLDNRIAKTHKMAFESGNLFTNLSTGVQDLIKITNFDAVNDYSQLMVEYSVYFDHNLDSAGTFNNTINVGGVGIQTTVVNSRQDALFMQHSDKVLTTFTAGDEIKITTNASFNGGAVTLTTLSVTGIK